MSVSTPPGLGQRVLVVDNLDSFTGSLVQDLQVLGADVVVARDAVPLDGFDRILLSPGPGRPEEHPWMLAVLDAARVPVFGVCLGMQAMALRAGGAVVPAKRIVHGWTSAIHHRGEGVFTGLPSPFRATRYHSLAVAQLPRTVRVTAKTRDREIMGMKVGAWEGVQFHPESVRSEHGRALLGNWLRG